MTTLNAVTITVTQEHIDKGRRESMMRSPIALAVLDAVPGATAASEYHDAVAISLRGRPGSIECALPTEAQAFATGFDAGNEPDPITFTLQIPDEAAS